MCPVTKTFSINTLVAAITSIAAELSTPAPLKAIFRSLTILPGALMMKRTDWVPPPPAKQSIVTDFVIVGEENSPTPAQMTVPPSATLFNAPAKLRQAVPGDAQSALSIPVLDTYVRVWARACETHERVDSAAATRIAANVKIRFTAQFPWFFICVKAPHSGPDRRAKKLRLSASGDGLFHSSRFSLPQCQSAARRFTPAGSLLLAAHDRRHGAIGCIPDELVVSVTLGGPVDRRRVGNDLGCGQGRAAKAPDTRLVECHFR